jgi:hypothetical protein
MISEIARVLRVSRRTEHRGQFRNRCGAAESRYRQVGNMTIGQLEDSDEIELIDGRPNLLVVAARLIPNSLSKPDLRGVAADMETTFTQS